MTPHLDINPQNSQIIVLDENFQVISSNDIIFNLKEGSSIEQFHPFFTQVDLYFESEEKKLNCVEIHDKLLDISFSKNASNRTIQLVDNSVFYSRLQEIAQKRNESYIFNEVLELKNDMLEEAASFKNKFISNFSHEMKSPLTLISAFSSMLVKSDLPLEQNKLVEAIYEQSENLKKILEDIIELSFLKRNQIELNPETINFIEYLENFKFKYTTKASNLGFSFSLKIGSQVPEYIEIDKRRLDQILTNLIENAIYFNNGENIVLTVKENQRRASKASLRFKISGEGVIPETVASNNLPELSSDIQIKGLGFSIAKELLDVYSGSLYIEKDKSGNSVQVANLRVKVPLNVDIPKAAPTESPTKPTFSEKAKIIIAEDNGITQYTAIKVLVNEKNFNTIVFSDPRDLLNAVENKDYDLILMSSSLSQVDAIELLNMIKEFANDHNKKIPVIALTTETDKKRISEFKKSGFKQVVQKPYTDDELLESVYSNLKIKKFI
ncbi:response regulator [Nonlabens tegetincola]|uniref:hybrid sensor histidine kinase/response regulator n=1 Tax=Nonlabens tegetincola TaxID=323273 RepID=UPI0030C83FB8